MDCYIVRVYRHITGKNGQVDEIAGLVERVGSQDNGKPFSSYHALVNAMQEEIQAQSPDTPEPDNSQVSGVRKVYSVGGS